MSDEHNRRKKSSVKKVVEVKPKIKVVRELPIGEEVSERTVETKEDVFDSSSEDNGKISRSRAPVLDRVGEVVEVHGASRRVGDEGEHAFTRRQFYETQQGSAAYHEQQRSGNSNERVYTPPESSLPTRSQRAQVSGAGMLDHSENMLPENERARQIEQEQSDQQYRHEEQQQQVRTRRRYPWEA